MTLQNGDPGPFGEEPIEHVPLSGAPLVKVVCQVRWPALTAFTSSKNEILEHLGKAVTRQFPVTRRQNEVNLVVGPAGVSQQQGAEIFQFVSAEDDWTLALANSFMALETSAYKSQADFCDRFKYIFETLSEVCQIPYVDRIGYRYVNRVAGQDNVAQIHDTIKESVRGGGAVPTVENTEMIHTLTETVYRIRDSRLLARWAVLPPGVTVDPSVPGVEEPSWVLDLDSYREGRIPPDPDRILTAIRELSDLGYKFFRWAVDEDFLRRFGGEV